MVGGGSSYTFSSTAWACALDRFDAAAWIARKGEFAAFGTLDKGTRRVVIAPRICGDGGIDTAAIRKDIGHRRGPEQWPGGALADARTRRAVWAIAKR